MPKTVTHGQVRRTGEKDKYGNSIAVDKLSFPDINDNRNVIVGDKATLTLKGFLSPKWEAYKLGEKIVYEDSNNNNTTHFKVTRVHGPVKYDIEVTF